MIPHLNIAGIFGHPDKPYCLRIDGFHKEGKLSTLKLACLDSNKMSVKTLSVSLKSDGPIVWMVEGSYRSIACFGTEGVVHAGEIIDIESLKVVSSFRIENIKDIWLKDASLIEFVDKAGRACILDSSGAVLYLDSTQGYSLFSVHSKVYVAKECLRRGDRFFGRVTFSDYSVVEFESESSSIVAILDVDGSRLLVVGNGGTVACVSTETRSVIWKLHFEGRQFFDLAYRCRDGILIALLITQSTRTFYKWAAIDIETGDVGDSHLPNLGLGVLVNKGANFVSVDGTVYKLGKEGAMEVGGF